MKKILVVLLILTVASGVFAEWSVDGSAHVDAVIDFYDTTAADPAWIRTGTLEDGYQGDLNLMYAKNGLTAGFNFNTGGGITAKMAYEGLNYSFVAEQKMHHLLRSISNYSGPNTGIFEWGLDVLQGKYAMINQILNLTVAFKSTDDDGYWLSDTTALGGYDYLFGRVRDYTALGTTEIVAGVPIGDGFAKVNGDNFFMANLTFSALNFGIIVPNAFNWFTYDHNALGDYYYYVISDTYIGTLVRNAIIEEINGNRSTSIFQDNNNNLRFMEGVLKHTIFGVSFDMNPITFALQLAMKDFGAYLGVGFKLNERMYVGVSFAGLFANWYDTNAVGGLNFDVNFGSFGAGVKLWYGVDGLFPDGEKGTVGIEPYFFYNVIPTHFRFYVDGLFALNAGDIFWRFAPEITWNFRGQGAGEWGDIGTGFLIRLNVEKEDDYSNYYLSSNSARGQSTLGFAFKWNFF